MGQSLFMRVALCTRNAGNPVIQLLAHTLTAAGHSADVIDDPRQVLADADRWDVAFWRADSRNAMIAAFAREAAVILDGRGVPFLNSLRSMNRAGSKLVSHALFAAAGLPVIPTWITPKPDQSLSSDVHGPLIVKPLWDKATRGISLCATLEEALEAARALDQPSLLQQPVAWRYQHRCVCTHQNVVRSYRDENPERGSATIRGFDRFAALPEQTTNQRVAALAMAMICAVDGDLMRADILEDDDGRLWALEINSSFGFPHDDQVILEAFLRGFADAAARRHRVDKNPSPPP